MPETNAAPEGAIFELPPEPEAQADPAPPEQEPVIDISNSHDLAMSAQRLLREPAFLVAVAEAEKENRRTWLAATDTAQREACWAQSKALQSLQSQLERLCRDHKAREVYEAHMKRKTSP